MDFDTLIFILVVLAVVISNIKKVLAERKKKGKTEKTDPLQKIFGKIISRIQEEISPESRDSYSNVSDSRESGPGRSSGWDAIMDEELPVMEEGGEEDYIHLETEAPELEVIEEPKPTLEEKIETREVSLPRAEDIPEPWVSVDKVSELRKAIVWSEILATPVGLRED